MRALKTITKEERTEIMKKWFENQDDKFDNFRLAMSKLKQFSSDGAHPIEFNSELVDVDTAKELITNRKFYKDSWKRSLTDNELKTVAIEFVDKLNDIRKKNGDTQLLYN